MKLSVYTGGFAQTNGYLVETPDGNFLIDAPDGVAKWIEGRGVRVDDVILTHQHYDHVMDAAALSAAGAKLHAFAPHSRELTLEDLFKQIGMPMTVEPYVVDSIFDLDEKPVFGGYEFHLAHVPGHSTDSVTFHLPSEGILFSGDTIFAGSVGRTDLPKGSTKQLIDGIVSKLLTLPTGTKVFPGHGPSTTIGDETAGNPYLT